MATSQKAKQQLGMTGEWSVCSELCKRGHNAVLTMGNTKAVDVVVLMPNKTYKTIEVKTTRSTRFVTGFFQKYHDINNPHPDIWVLVHIDKNDDPHYYVLTHQEMGQVQMARNGMSTWTQVQGVDNVLLKHVSQYQDEWHKI